jgi:hypothetical protein
MFNNYYQKARLFKLVIALGLKLFKKKGLYLNN